MKQTIIKPSTAIRQNYNQISELAKKSGQPIFLTKSGEGDLVVMDIRVYDQREQQLELREKLLSIEENRKAGVKDSDARAFGAQLRSRIKVKK